MRKNPFIKKPTLSKGGRQLTSYKSIVITGIKDVKKVKVIRPEQI